MFHLLQPKIEICLKYFLGKKKSQKAAIVYPPKIEMTYLKKFVTLFAPSLEYWPIETSRNIIGMPTKTNIVKYGIRNDPPPFK